MTKSTVLAVLVFAALAVAGILTLQDKPERGITRISFDQIDPDRVDRVLIAGSHDVELLRQGEHWQIDGKRADGTAVDRVLEAIAEVRSSDLATENEERFAELEVDEEKGAAVSVFVAGQQVAEFVIGSSSRGGSHVRVGDAVYSVRGIHRATFARDPAGWVERRLFFDAFEDVNRVDVALGGARPYALLKEGESWKLEDSSTLPSGDRFDANAAARLARSLVSARAAEVLDEDPGDAAGLGDDADQLRFSVAGSDGQSVLTLGSAQEDGTVYARSSQRQPPVTVRDSTAKELRKTLLDLRDLSIMEIDPATVERIEIVDEQSRLVLEKSGSGWDLVESSDTPAEDFELDQMMVRRRLSTLGGLRAVAEAESASVVEGGGLEQPSKRVVLGLEGGEAATLAFGDTVSRGDDEAVLARGNLDQRTYLIEPAQRDQLLAGLESLRKREAPAGGGLGGLDPQALQNLPPEVRDSLLQQMQQQAQREAMMRAMEAQAAQ